LLSWKWITLPEEPPASIYKVKVLEGLRGTKIDWTIRETGGRY
jgi:hypothetical protein